MLTVIIAEQHIIEQYDKYKMLFTPFEGENICFCRWNCEGRSLDEMLPDLHEIVSFSTDWRAVIVTENNKDKLNPFDYVNYSDFIDKKNKLRFDTGFIDTCRNTYACFEKSLCNPLTKLSTALCEIPLFAEVIDCDVDSLLTSVDTLVRYIFRKHIEPLNTKRITTELRKFREKELALFVKEESLDDFLVALSEKNYPVIFNHIPTERLIHFLEVSRIANSASVDPGYWLAVFENTKKAQLYDSLKENFKLNFAFPREVLYLTTRTYDTKLHNSKVIWDDRPEDHYSDFVRYNLYNENIRFLIYDMPEEDYGNRTHEVVKFQLLLQHLAMYGNTSFSILKNRTYVVDIKYDKHELSRVIARLIVRQKKTALHINDEIFILKSKKIPPLDNRSARVLFESNIKIPVQWDKEYRTNDFLVEHDIGLYRDHPIEELEYWESQFFGVKKLFKRFLREPRRAVKRACSDDFRERNRIEDIRAVGLNDNQKEDILIKLEEEEQNMVSTVTSAIYDTKRYNEAMDKAGKIVEDAIKIRLTKKRTLYCMLIALVAYFIGFLPLMFGNLNTLKSFFFSTLVSGATVMVLAICGIIYTIVLKHRQIQLYNEFNDTVRSIFSEINGSLTMFSEYLSHACMVMRETSALNMAETKETADLQKIKVLSFNLLQLQKEIDSNYKLLSEFSDFDPAEILEAADKDQLEAYGYDYLKIQNFEYAFFEEKDFRDIDYMLKGFKVRTPVAFVEEVTLKREELYD